jgi:uncharacterized cupin superfamily protein
MLSSTKGMSPSTGGHCAGLHGQAGPSGEQWSSPDTPRGARRRNAHTCRYCMLDRSGAGILSAVIGERSALMAQEPTPGAGVTTWLVADQAWEHDEETGGQVAMLVDSPNVQAGLWKPGRSGLGPIEVELDHTEIILVLSGTGQLEVDGGAPLELTPGRAARIDVGAHTRWMVDQEFTELWLYV